MSLLSLIMAASAATPFTRRCTPLACARFKPRSTALGDRSNSVTSALSVAIHTPKSAAATVVQHTLPLERLLFERRHCRPVQAPPLEERVRRIVQIPFEHGAVHPQVGIRQCEELFVLPVVELALLCGGNQRAAPDPYSTRPPFCPVIRPPAKAATPFTQTEWMPSAY